MSPKLSLEFSLKAGKMPMNVYILTLGCKVNAYESQYMLESCLAAGYKEAQSIEEADVIIVNSCTVTETSLNKTQKMIKKAKKYNSDAIVVLCGCIPQAYPHKLKMYDFANIIMGTSNRSNLVKNIEIFLKNKENIIDIKAYKKDNTCKSIDSNVSMKISKFKDRARAFVKIEDGCENYCSYCMIPFARGFVRSKPLADIAKEISDLSINNYAEIVLTGINLSAYGKNEAYDLCDAIAEVSKNERIKRIRLGSLELNFLTEKNIQKLSEFKKLCPHFHISLQSGCDSTLKRMNRKYTTAQYLDTVKNIRKYFKNSAITTDLIVAFPGETDLEFKTSMDFIKLVGFSKIHVFPYSKREGTVAAGMDMQINPEIKRLRSQVAIEIADKLATSFLQTQIAKRFSVLFETKLGENIYEGFTDNYLHFKASSDIDLRGQIRSVLATGLDGKCLIGGIQ